MKILLISANTVQDPYPVYPLGLDYVAGAIPEKHSVLIADLNLENALTNLQALLDSEQPDVIGISLRNIDNTDTTDPRGFTNQYKNLTALIRTHSTAPIVLGGSGFSIFPRELMALLDADYGIAGEGERFATLLEALEGDTHPAPGSSKSALKLAEIPGLYTKESQGGKWCCSGKTHTMNSRFNRAFSPQSPHLDFYLDRGECSICRPSEGALLPVFTVLIP